MIYLVAIALVLTLFGLYRRSRVLGFPSTLVDLLAASLTGWIAGLLIGIGARIGMWVIPFVNGAESRFTIEGTIQVILVFSLFGIGLGPIYEFLFRDLLRNRGAIFGLIVTIVAAYPLAVEGLEQIPFTPPLVPTILVSLLVVGVMFIPFGVALELMLRRYHRFRKCEHLSPAQIGM